jgi:hypothetical protein
VFDRSTWGLVSSFVPPTDGDVAPNYIADIFAESNSRSGSTSSSPKNSRFVLRLSDSIKDQEHRCTGNLNSKMTLARRRLNLFEALIFEEEGNDSDSLLSSISREILQFEEEESHVTKEVAATVSCSDSGCDRYKGDDDSPWSLPN